MFPQKIPGYVLFMADQTSSTAQKIKFCIKEFLSKCDQCKMEIFKKIAI